MAADEKFCDIPKNCDVKRKFNKENNKSNNKQLLSCLITSGHEINFNRSVTINTTKCKNLEENLADIYFKTSRYKPTKLSKSTLNLSSLRDFIWGINQSSIYSNSIIFDSFRGFDIDLFDSSMMNQSEEMFNKQFDIQIACYECVFEFYKENKKLNSCQEITTQPNSIFQTFSFLNQNLHSLVLSESKSKICPLMFKNYYVAQLYLEGYNSFFSRRVLTFSNETFFPYLDSNILEVDLHIPNVDIDPSLLNPAVFKEIQTVTIVGKVNSINSDFLVKFYKLTAIYFESLYFRSLIHKGGIGWIKSMNKGLKVNLNDSYQLRFFYNLQAKYIFLDCSNTPTIPPLDEVFPDEDFCLYKDFPFRQLINFVQSCYPEDASVIKLSCTLYCYIALYCSVL